MDFTVDHRILGVHRNEYRLGCPDVTFVRWTCNYRTRCRFVPGESPRAKRRKPMPTNIELKARVPDLAFARRVAVELATVPARILNQTDTYFHASSGRLKLREFGD